MKEECEALLALAPRAPQYALDWDAIERSALAPVLERMKSTPQEKKWHGEGSVLNHTRLVCQALADSHDYRRLERRRQEILFLAALLHDIGKCATTRLQDGILVSPHHSETGSRMARAWLWTECGLCGTPREQIMREAVCRLIRWHMTPEHMLEGDQPEIRLRRIAAEGELAPDFSIDLLCILAQADMRGRICDDLVEQLEQIELCRIFAKENGCLDGPAAFAGDHTKRAFFSGRSVLHDQLLYDDTWGEVIMLCGLPGTGKDTYIAGKYPLLETVSLDDIRAENGVRPGDNQGAVVQESKERARVYLRAHRPFVFNATNLTLTTREPLVRLFEQYGARVRIVFLETAWEEQLRRNSQRKRQVPEHVIAAMLDKLSPPERWEAQMVEWICV
ncbi:MAG: AAA family ATPase [Clostridia bacterium]|nr:AAA family ATPase [Clostridia bacterium]